MTPIRQAYDSVFRFFGFHKVASALATPLSTPTPTPSLVKPALSGAIAELGLGAVQRKDKWHFHAFYDR